MGAFKKLGSGSGAPSGWLLLARARRRRPRNARFVADRIEIGATYPIGSAVVDLIFSIAKREVTFFNGTAAISRL